MREKKNASGSSSIEDLKNYKGPDQVISSYDLDEILRQSGDYEFILKSKIPLLDAYLDGGFESGELITISGPPKTGKTLLSQSFTSAFLDQEQRSLWFEYEVTPKRFLRSFPELLKFWVPMRLEANDLNWLHNRILEGIYKQGISAVFIDHLHFLFDILSKGNTSLEIGRVIRTLKKIAIDQNIVIFLMAHMAKIRKDEEPDDSKIRDSSLIGSESDTVLLIWRDPDKDNQATVKIQYSRRSGCRDKKIKLIKQEGLLYGYTDN